jgi:hypothetical protein
LSDDLKSGATGDQLLTLWLWALGRSKWCCQTSRELPKGSHYEAADLGRQGRYFEAYLKITAADLLIGYGAGYSSATHVTDPPYEGSEYKPMTGLYIDVRNKENPFTGEDYVQFPNDVRMKLDPRKAQPIPAES